MEGQLFQVWVGLHVSPKDSSLQKDQALDILCIVSAPTGRGKVWHSPQLTYQYIGGPACKCSSETLVGFCEIRVR